MVDAALSTEELSALAEVLRQNDDFVIGGKDISDREDVVDAEVLSAILNEDTPSSSTNDDNADPLGALRGEHSGSESARAHDHTNEYGFASGARASASAGWGGGGESEPRVLRSDVRSRHTGGRVEGFLQVDELDWMREVLKRGGGGACSFDASQSLLVVGQSSGAVLIADRETREVVQTLAPPRMNAAGSGGAGAVVCVKLCPLGQYVVAAYWNSRSEGGNAVSSCDLRIFDWRRNSLIKSVQNRHLAPVSKLEFIGSARFLSADTQGLVLLVSISSVLMMTVVNVDVVLAVSDGLGEILALSILHRGHHLSDGGPKDGGEGDSAKKDKEEVASLECLVAVGTRDLVFVAAIWPTTRILFKLPCPSSQPEKDRARGPSVAWGPAPSEKPEGAVVGRGRLQRARRATLVIGWGSAVKLISLEFCDGSARTKMWSSPVSSPGPTSATYGGRDGAGAGATTAGLASSSSSSSSPLSGAGAVGAPGSREGQERRVAGAGVQRWRRAGVPKFSDGGRVEVPDGGHVAGLRWLSCRILALFVAGTVPPPAAPMCGRQDDEVASLEDKSGSAGYAAGAGNSEAAEGGCLLLLDCVSLTLVESVPLTSPEATRSSPGSLGPGRCDWTERGGREEGGGVRWAEKCRSKFSLRSMSRPPSVCMPLRCMHASSSHSRPLPPVPSLPSFIRSSLPHNRPATRIPGLHGMSLPGDLFACLPPAGGSIRTPCLTRLLSRTLRASQPFSPLRWEAWSQEGKGQVNPVAMVHESSELSATERCRGCRKGSGRHGRAVVGAGRRTSSPPGWQGVTKKWSCCGVVGKDGVDGGVGGVGRAYFGCRSFAGSVR